MARFILVDIEGEGGVSPYSGRMTEFGAVDLQSMTEFHGVLWPASPDPENPAVPLVAEDAVPFDHDAVFKEFEAWLKAFGDRIVWVSDNPGYDMCFLSYYLDKHLGYNPGGHSSRRIGDLYAGLSGNWRNTSKWKKWRQTNHSHVSVEDARGNAEALRTILAEFGQRVPWESLGE